MDNKVIELAKQAGLINGYGGRETASDELLQKFYTLARADYETKLSAVMPADFKDWHENNRNEWPEVAAWVITNLREQRADLEAERDMYKATAEATACMHCDAENAKLREVLERVYVTCDWHGDDGRDAMQAAYAAMEATNGQGN